VAKDVGDYVGEEELVAMIDEFDQTGEGAIGLEDFLAIMQYASA
jgi:centrin-3